MGSPKEESVTKDKPSWSRVSQFADILWVLAQLPVRHEVTQAVAGPFSRAFLRTSLCHFSRHCILIVRKERGVNVEAKLKRVAWGYEWIISFGNMSGFFSSFFGRDCADIEVDPNADPFDKSEMSQCVVMLREKVFICVYSVQLLITCSVCAGKYAVLSANLRTVS